MPRGTRRISQRVCISGYTLDAQNHLEKVDAWARIYPRANGSGSTRIKYAPVIIACTRAVSVWLTILRRSLCRVYHAASSRYTRTHSHIYTRNRSCARVRSTLSFLIDRIKHRRIRAVRGQLRIAFSIRTRTYNVYVHTHEKPTLVELMSRIV